MISRDLFTRLLSGMRAGEPATGDVGCGWLTGVSAPPFTLKGKWTTSATQERWQVSLGCMPKTVPAEAKKRPAYLRLVEPTAG